MTDETQKKDEEQNVLEEKKPEDVSERVVEVNIDFKEKWMRAQADYANLVKETSARRSEWAAMSEAQVLEDFLPVYDNFCKAFSEPVANGVQAAGDDAKKFENWKKGIEYIMQQFWTVLKNYNIEKIETVGKNFDPTKHEAVGDEAVEGKDAGEILREVDPGYMKQGKVLKVAKVIVSA